MARSSTSGSRTTIAVGVGSLRDSKAGSSGPASAHECPCPFPRGSRTTDFLAILRLAFSDIVAAQTEADVLFGSEHAAAILDFVDQWPQAEHLIIHCHVGASRSPGVALGLCDVFGWPTATLERDHPAWNRWVRQVLATHGA